MMNKTLGITLVVMAAAIAGTFLSVHTAFAQTSSSSSASSAGNAGSAGAATGTAATSAGGASAIEGSPVTCVGSNGVGVGQTISGSVAGISFSGQNANSGCQVP
jgi:hypothetical protein